MAARNLLAAVGACGRHPDLLRGLGVTKDELKMWRQCAEAVHLPYDEELGVHPNSFGYTDYDVWDFEAFLGRYPLMMHAPYVQLYRKQVLKQVDLVLALHWVPEYFTDEQTARNVDYYEKITVRDSSLSACTQSVMCAQVGHLELAHDYAHEAALVDLRNLHHNTRDGLHLASLGGAWSTLVEGFGGLRERGDVLSLDPHLPPDITGLSFHLRRQGMRLLVEVTHQSARVSLRDGVDGRVSLVLCGKPVEVTTQTAVELPITPLVPLLPPPTQPLGRAPAPRE